MKTLALVAASLALATSLVVAERDRCTAILVGRKVRLLGDEIQQRAFPHIVAI
jgi:hypothetical protein